MSYGSTLTALQTGTANTTPGSQVYAQVAPTPNAYLRLDTGEVIGVPAGDTTALNNEFDKWNRLMHEQMLANEVLAVCDERLSVIARELAARPRSVNRATIEQAEQAQALAIQWREEATQSLRKELAPLDRLGGNGKKLIELIPLLDGNNASPARFERGADDGQWKRDGTDLKTAWSFKTGAGLRDHFMQEARYKGLGPLRVLSSDKLKARWPRFKDKQSMKWADVYKTDANGQRKIDRTKMRQYLGEQVMKLKVDSKNFGTLEISNTGTLGPEALANWNASATFSKEGKLVFGDTPIGDIDLGAEAAAMRYFSGASLSGEIAPLQGNVSVKAEGSAEIAFAEGKAGASLYLPSREGVMLYLLDIEQIAAISKGQAMPRKPYDMGAVRVVAAAELKGVIGVCLAGELSLEVAMKDVDVADLDGRRKRGRAARLSGKGRRTRRARNIDVNGQGDAWKNVASAAAEVEFFAGAKGGLELKGALQWRNPHNEQKEFEVMASIAPEIQGQAGIGASARWMVDYVDGVFRITAHAGICFGVGAEGTVSFAVGVKQLASFMYWIYYNLLHVGFRNLVIISEQGFRALKHLTYLMVCQGKKVEEYFLVGGNALAKVFRDIELSYQRAENSYALGKQILGKPAATRFSPPEAKGMLIYQLTRHRWQSIATEPGLGSSYLRTQKQAVLSILRQTQLKSDIENVIQHISADGSKGSFERNFSELKAFFAVEGPSGLDLPGMTTHETDLYEYLDETGFNALQLSNARHSLGSGADRIAMAGNFGAWYDKVHASLKDEPTRGYVAVGNDTVAYALQRNMRDDHPLYASAAGGFYS
ncbi:hypothetical protein [Aromatoleum petrolei]|uniref:Uncharacterized protein n=1 Tax=Aromatoleum petrolei TaxID=76116 RepID=A0ABX1MUE1_9RHOO|nr:hypothetical protein [Aromatoleum petrolei]NMF91598.1 hypothetical protein [Aromatoleum petrolei]QTQ36850.1 Uncharacterized protein ToN1_27140 [Aromatoleum petrolei]